MTTLRRQQFLILAGMMLSALVAYLAAQFTPWLAAGARLPTGDPGSRLAFAFHWSVAPAICLLTGVGMTANRRFLSADAIAGTERPTSRSLEINLRYNRNTLEQAVLAVLAWVGAAVTFPVSELRVIPVLAGLFVLGRAAFWLGYLYTPWARAFGFGLTFYPTLVLYVALLVRLLAP